MEEDTSQTPSQWRHLLQRTQEEQSNQTFTLPNGRSIGYAIFGATNSHSTVFYLHGFPGSRLSGVIFDEPGKNLDVKIIALDRPAIGLSSPHHNPKHGALDHVEDLRLLAEHLEIKSYGVLGVSGGGPYALACAYALPREHLRSVSIVAGAGPYSLGLQGMKWSNWFIFQGLRYFPALMRWFQTKVAAVLASIPTEKLVEAAQSRLQNSFFKRWFGPDEKDAEFLEDSDFLALMIELNKEHYRQGVEGFMGDGKVLTSDLGFRLEDIGAEMSPVLLWYGKRDVNVPLRVGEALHALLGVGSQLVVRDETHLSLVFKGRWEVLERLVERMGM